MLVGHWVSFQCGNDHTSSSSHLFINTQSFSLSLSVIFFPHFMCPCQTMHSQNHKVLMVNMFTHSFCYIVCATLCILKWDEYHDDDEIHKKIQHVAIFADQWTAANMCVSFVWILCSSVNFHLKCGSLCGVSPQHQCLSTTWLESSAGNTSWLACCWGNWGWLSRTSKTWDT